MVYLKNSYRWKILVDYKINELYKFKKSSYNFISEFYKDYFYAFITILIMEILVEAEIDLFVPSFPEIQTIFNISTFEVVITWNKLYRTLYYFLDCWKFRR